MITRMHLMFAKTFKRGMQILKEELYKLRHQTSGQGTTEYAILVGVLVIIAIAAILAFKDRVSDLWNAIAEGINSL